MKKVVDKKAYYEKFECDLDGPILITAAHSARLLWGRGLKGEWERIHLREKWVSNISIGLANCLSLIAG